MVGQELPAVFLLSNKQGRQLQSLLGGEVPHLLHVDPEGEEELLLQFDDDEMSVVQDLAEIMELLEAGSYVVRLRSGVSQPNRSCSQITNQRRIESFHYNSIGTGRDHRAVQCSTVKVKYSNCVSPDCFA